MEAPACRFFKAYWVDLVGAAPPIWRGSWTCGLYELPVWLQQLCSRVGKRGWPDVVAWKEATKEVRFVEYKGLKDAINKNQDIWFRTALKSAAIDRNSYVVAGWNPDQAQMLHARRAEGLESVTLPHTVICLFLRS